jgi:type I restriction enzyme S subunit
MEKFVFAAEESLPAEIHARRQQYEYYRNKLLTFKELELA